MSNKESRNDDSGDSQGGIMMGLAGLFGRDVEPMTATADVEYSNGDDEQ